jgi:hypothetical protein
MYNHKLFDKATLLRMNNDPKYGYNWISNLQNVRENETLKLYPTGEFGFTTGRIYVALPAKKVLTEEEYIRHNIIIRV